MKTKTISVILVVALAVSLLVTATPPSLGPSTASIGGPVLPAVAAGFFHTVGLKCDGTVIAVGNNWYGQCDVGSWTDIVQVSAGYLQTVGLKSDGTVGAVGMNEDGQCEVGSWTDIVQVSTNGVHTVGLKSDGTVVAAGRNDWGQCDVASWTDIVQVAGGADHTVGLKSDGTLAAIGDNEWGQCDVASWTDIVQVSAGTYGFTVGLKSDGTVVAVGNNEWGQCEVGSWTDIVQVSAGCFHTVGLKADGTLVAAGRNDDGGGEAYGWCDVGSWNGIVQVAAGGWVTVGLSSDGTATTAGMLNPECSDPTFDFGQWNVSEWDLAVCNIPTLSSITVAPTSPASLGISGTQQFVATGTYSDGLTADITSQVAWSSSNPATATLSPSGLATGVSSGISCITASLSGIVSGCVLLTVVNTPAGQDVAVIPTDPETGEPSTEVTMEFGSVLVGGDTTITTSSTGPFVSTLFKLGSPPKYFEISTTAQYDATAGIEISIDYSEMQFGNESQLELWHWDGAGWQKLEILSLDTENNRIRALAYSLSPFALVEPNLPPVAQVATDKYVAGINEPFSFSADVSYDQDGSVVSYKWDFGDSSAGTGSTASHAYAAAGLYSVVLTVTDDTGAEGSASMLAVVYDPSAGYVTGGGWISSPTGAYAADPTLSGPAYFGFLSKYYRGKIIPDGQTDFHFYVGNLCFRSTSYDWLVVAGAKAQFKGSGTINGRGNYGFMLTAIDGQAGGGGGADRFRIKIWDKTTGNVIYDNNMDAPDDANPTTRVALGSIILWKW